MYITIIIMDCHSRRSKSCFVLSLFLSFSPTHRAMTEKNETNSEYNRFQLSHIMSACCRMYKRQTFVHLCLFCCWCFVVVWMELSRECIKKMPFMMITMTEIWMLQVSWFIYYSHRWNGQTEIDITENTCCLWTEKMHILWIFTFSRPIICLIQQFTY